MVEAHHHFSDATENITGSSSPTIGGKMEVIAFHLANHFERFQIQSSSLITTANHRIYVLYEQLLQWLESQNVPDRFREVSETISSQARDFIETLKSGVQVSHYYNHARTFFLRHEVSKQAIYFGFAGLITGSVIGLCIGYSFNKSSGSSVVSSPNSDSSSNHSINGRTSIRLMKAIICFSPRNGIDGVSLSSIPIPTISHPNQLLVQVRATGVDNVDVKIAHGYSYLLRQYFGNSISHRSKRTSSYTLGRECSGIVIDVGSQVTNFDINDRVWICLPLWYPQGVMSEYIVVPEQYVGHKPKNISFEGAAVMPYASFTFWRNIVSKTNESETSPALYFKNKRVLIHLGFSSKNDGVGLLATQILKAWGARVTISTQEEVYSPSSSSSASNYSDENEKNYDSGDTDDEDDEETSYSSRKSKKAVSKQRVKSSAQMTFLHTLNSLGAESHIIIPKDESLLPDLTQRIFDIVINTDKPTLTPLLHKFAKDPSEKVIETFPLPVEMYSRSLWTKLFPNSIVSYLTRKDSANEALLDTSLYLDQCKRLVESGHVIPVVAKSFLPSQYDQAFQHVSNLTRSALVQAHVGKSVILFKVS